MSRADEDEVLDGLIERAQIGDPAAFDDIVRRLEQPLLGFCRAHGAQDPDGTVNEVLLRVFSGILVFEGGAPQFRAWVFRITRNLIIDEQRRERRRPDTTPVEPQRLPEPTADAPLDRIDETERVRNLLDDVPPDQREVLILRIVGGLSVPEVAEVLGKRTGAVRALQHRALERLRRELSMEP